MIATTCEKTFSITMTTLATCMEVIMPILRDDNVFEVYVNPDGRVWQDGINGRKFAGVVLTPAQAKQIILNVAALTSQLVTDEKPAIDADIPANNFFDKCRFEGNLPGIVSAPTFNIRKHPKKIFTLEDYVAQGILSEQQHHILLRAIRDKKNIIAAGGTKSGKTTLLNALLAEISKCDDRVILIEDTPELQCSTKDCVSMRTMRSFSMTDCLRCVLRMTPDRIVVGEVRGGEALALLDAWSTGHGGGCSTVHSNSAKDTLLRLENMTARVSQNPQQATIGQAVNLIVYLKYTGGHRMVEDIIEVNGYDSAKQQYNLRKID